MNNLELKGMLKVTHKVNDLLARYVDINNDIFKPSLRKIIALPRIFKKINYHSNYVNLLDIENEFNSIIENVKTLISEYEDSSIEYTFLNVLSSYCNALLNTIVSLKNICFKMSRKIDGLCEYPYNAFDADVDVYNSLVNEYTKLGLCVNEYYKDVLKKDTCHNKNSLYL